MNKFSYLAQDPKTGQKERGELEAEGQKEATERLKSLGLLPIRVESKNPSKIHFFKRSGVPLKEKIIFTRQLAVMTKAGLSLVNALKALQRQTENQNFKKVIATLITEVKGGTMLSVVMQRYPRVFSEVYISVVKAGEQTGQLSEVLFNLADQQEKEAELIAKVKGAMIYPALILAALIGVVFIIVYFVLPSLQQVFADMGSELPLTTRLLFGFSTITRRYFFIVLPVLIGLGYLIHWYVGKPAGKRMYDRIKLKLPIFGSLTKKVYMARFSRTMAMLTKASLPILDSLRIVKKTLNNYDFDQAFLRVEKAVESGQPVSQAINKEPLFPPMVAQLISLGEESGNLEGVLLEIARFYDSEVENMSRNLSSLIEPLLLIFMGLGVAFVVASVLGPIYKLVSQFQ